MTSNAVAPLSAGQERPDEPRAKRLPALDGVRGIAGAGIVVYHLRNSTPPGLGQAIMELFFALSGYLITGVVLDLVDRPKRARTFYARRARRLLPALAVYLVAGIALAAILGWGTEGSVLKMAIASALYLANWWEAIRPGVDIRPFGGLWSLSIEEQFYFVWPLVCWTALRLRRRASSVGAVALLTALIALLLRIRAVDADWTLLRARSGLDTRVLALALGAAARVWLPPGRLTTWLATATSAFGSALFILAIASVRIYDVRTLATWWSLAAAGAVLLVAGAASGGLVAWLLALPPLTFIGRISYSLYLWHPAVIAAAEPHVLGLSPSARHVVLGGASVVVATASYRFIEQPFQRRRTRVGQPRPDAPHHLLGRRHPRRGRRRAMPQADGSPRVARPVP